MIEAEVNPTKQKVLEENRKDPFWVLRDANPDLDNEELYELYMTLGLFENEQEKSLAEEYLAEQILLEE